MARILVSGWPQYSARRSRQEVSDPAASARQLARRWCGARGGWWAGPLRGAVADPASGPGWPCCKPAGASGRRAAACADWGNCTMAEGERAGPSRTGPAARRGRELRQSREQRSEGDGPAPRSLRSSSASAPLCGHQRLAWRSSSINREGQAASVSRACTHHGAGTGYPSGAKAILCCKGERRPRGPHPGASVNVDRPQGRLLLPADTCASSLHRGSHGAKLPRERSWSGHGPPGVASGGEGPARTL